MYVGFQPKFLSKEERAAAAIKRREEEVARMKQQQIELEQKRKEFLNEAKKGNGMWRVREGVGGVARRMRVVVA